MSKLSKQELACDRLAKVDKDGSGRIVKILHELEQAGLSINIEMSKMIWLKNTMVIGLSSPLKRRK